MGIRFWCPNGHKLNVKTFQAGRRGVCPYCGARFQIPTESTRKPGTKDLIPEPQEHSVHEAGGGVPPAAAPAAPLQGTGLAAGPAGPADAALYTPSAAAGYGGAGGYPAGQAVGGQPGPTVAGPTSRPETGPVVPLNAGAMFAPVGTPADPSAPMASAPQRAYASVPLASTSPPASAAGPAVPGDPLAEAPDAVWYVRPPAGGQFGPATADVMRNWMGEGRVSPDSLVWREGWRDWQEASGVFPQLGGVAGAGFLSPAATATAGAARTGRRQSKATNAIIITVLLLAVVVLFAVFVFVAFGPKSTKTKTERPAGKVAAAFSVTGQDAAAPSRRPAPCHCDGGRLA